MNRGSPLSPDWRLDLGRKIAWLLVLKVAALAVLWVLFFSPAHRPVADTSTIDARLALTAETFHDR